MGKVQFWKKFWRFEVKIFHSCISFRGSDIGKCSIVHASQWVERYFVNILADTYHRECWNRFIREWFYFLSWNLIQVTINKSFGGCSKVDTTCCGFLLHPILLKTMWPPASCLCVTRVCYNMSLRPTSSTVFTVFDLHFCVCILWRTVRTKWKLF